MANDEKNRTGKPIEKIEVEIKDLLGLSEEELIDAYERYEAKMPGTMATYCEISSKLADKIHNALTPKAKNHEEEKSQDDKENVVEPVIVHEDNNKEAKGSLNEKNMANKSKGSRFNEYEAEMIAKLDPEKQKVIIQSNIKNKEFLEDLDKHGVPGLGEIIESFNMQNGESYYKDGDIELNANDAAETKKSLGMQNQENEQGLDDGMIKFTQAELEKFVADISKESAQKAVKESEEKRLLNKGKRKLIGIKDKIKGTFNESKGKIVDFLKENYSKGKAFAGRLADGVKAVGNAGKLKVNQVKENIDEYGRINSKLDERASSYIGHKDSRGNSYELHELKPDEKQNESAKEGKEYILCMNGANGVKKAYEFYAGKAKNIDKEQLLNFVTSDKKNLEAIREPGASIDRDHEGKLQVFTDSKIIKEQETPQKPGTVENMKNAAKYAGHKIANTTRSIINSRTGNGQDVPGGR